MWTHVSISLVTAWDLAEWRCVATWRDDDTSVPVVLVKEGYMTMTPNDGPELLLRHAIEQCVLQGLTVDPG